MCKWVSHNAFFGNPRLTRSIIAFMNFTEHFWKFQCKIASCECCKNSYLNCCECQNGICSDEGHYQINNTILLKNFCYSGSNTDSTTGAKYFGQWKKKLLTGTQFSLGLTILWQKQYYLVLLSFSILKSCEEKAWHLRQVTFVT